MSDAHQQATNYFRKIPQGGWKWSENGNVVIWNDGTTVAFREELAQILEPLAAGGLPRFHSVVVLLAACRGKLPQADAGADWAKPGPAPWNDPANQEFSEFIAQLRAIHQLPEELRNSTRAKALLIEAIFARREERPVQLGPEIIDLLRNGLLSEKSLNEPGLHCEPAFAIERFLCTRLKNLTPDTLATRMRTGLDELPDEADVDLKPAERVRELLAQLREDPEHEGLAKVTRDVMAAIYLPRALSEMDELALGGFSDISNRGSLDRLLPSELAHDDVTLAARIALNEALYFRREPPANHPPGRFAVLLDAGVRTWGLPRVFATAVALALMGKEDRRGDVTAWRATPSGVEKIDLLTRRGLIDHLSVLQSGSHPGAALKPFFTQLAGEPELEAVLVTQRDTLADPGFQLQLREVTSAAFYIATVDRDGSFDLFLHPHRHSPLCQAVVPLESLFTLPGRKAAELRDPERDPNLPLILSVRPFPFLLPVVGKIQKAVWYSRSGGIAVMQDRRLLRWETSHRGAEVLAGNLPKGRAIWLGTSNFGNKVHVLKHRTNPPVALLTTWNTTTEALTSHELPLPDNQTMQAYTQNGVLFLVNRRRIIGFDMDTGQSLGTIAPPNPRFMSGGKYYIQPDGTKVFLTYDGQGLQFQPLTLDPALAAKDILTLFDREGFEGPWVLTVRGEVYSNTGERVINLARTIYGHEISSDGHRLLVRVLAPSAGDSQNFQLIDLATKQCAFVEARKAPKLLQPPVVPPTANVRVRFDAIHLSAAGGFALLGSSGTWRCLADRGGKLLALQETQHPLPPDAADTRKFEPVPLSAALPFKLKVATWPNGCRAWLDSRGLLHLKHLDPARPEISLVLSDNAMAVWSSDGQMSGNAFFMPPSTTPTPLPEMIAKLHCFYPG